VAELRREADRNTRSVRSAETEGKSREVRLNRALEEVERYRKLLEEAREQGNHGKDSAKHEMDKVLAENKRLQRQKSELITAFRKQMKLIDVLKKQKIHLEAARLLQFTEDEFLRTLDQPPVM